MQRFFILLSLLIFASELLAFEELPQIPQNAKAQTEPRFHEPLSRGIDLVFQDRFQQALAIFDSLENEFPNHPAPHFFKSATYQNLMKSYRTRTYQKELEKNVNLAIEKAQNLMQTENDSWLNFYVGACLGYRAFFKIRQKKWISGFIDASNGIENLEIALEKQPDLYDAYFGLGSYNYWRTARSKFIQIFAFWLSDKREIGIEQVKIATKFGAYSKNESTLALTRILWDFGKEEEALELIEYYIANLPNPTLDALYKRARLFAHFENWVKVETEFENILARLQNYEFQSYNFQVECKYLIAKAAYEQGKEQKALQNCEEGLKLSKKINLGIELESVFENSKKLVELLEELEFKIKNLPIKQ